MLSQETIQNLNKELESLNDEIKILNNRRKGIVNILGYKLSGHGKVIKPDQEFVKEETTPEPLQNASNEKPLNDQIFKVPLSFSFSYFDSVKKEWCAVMDKKAFTPGIIFQAVAGNRVVAFGGHKIMEVVEVGETHLHARRVPDPLPNGHQ